jgi:hypothetical protein
MYSLPVIKRQGGGTMAMALHNIENCVAQYGYRPDEVAPEHVGRFTERDHEMLRPLLEAQDYIDACVVWDGKDFDVDLDRFRGVLFRGFEGNYVEAYFRTFQIPFMKPADIIEPWLTVPEPKRVASIVVNRTSRYLSPGGDQVHQEYAVTGQLDKNGVFVGTPIEHAAYVAVTGVNIPYHPVNDFLELAEVIAGADLFIGSQSFAYSIAQGLGKDTILETIKIKPLINNECYFPREGCMYF